MSEARKTYGELTESIVDATEKEFLTGLKAGSESPDLFGIVWDAIDRKVWEAWEAYDGEYNDYVCDWIKDLKPDFKFA